MSWQYNNPYLTQQFAPNPYVPTPQQAPTMQVIRVNGRGGAEAFAIGPNSSALLLDESGCILWAIATDGAGYKTISPYDITPHQDAPAPDYSTLETRIARLEGILNELSGDSSTVSESKPAVTADQKSYGNGQKR